MPEMLTAGLWSLLSPMQIVFAEDGNIEFKKVVNLHYLPLSIKIHAGKTHGAYTKSLAAVNGNSTVFLCQNFTCELPITTIDVLEKRLSKILVL